MAEVVPKSGLRKKSVLIVDDNQIVQTTLAEIGRTLGFDVATAASRREATGLIDIQAFDVAIVDKKLVENDSKNRDGMAILKYLRDKNEGTKSILLTGYGEFEDASEAAFDLRTFAAIKKGPETEEEIRSSLIRAVNDAPRDKYQSAVNIWCGTEDPVVWSTRMNGLLKHSGKINVFNSLLDDLAKTLHPLLRRDSDNGIQKTSVPFLIAGYYWSRGVGSAVIVLICRGELPSPIPISDQWPKELRLIDPPLFKVNRKNLTGAVIKCEGAHHTDFNVACAYK